MIRAVIFAAFIAGISAQVCVPPVITHTETGDELYRVLLKDLSDVTDKAAAISAAAQGGSDCMKFESIGDFFTQLLVTFNADNIWLDRVGAGLIPGGDECIGQNIRMAFEQSNIVGKADTPVLPSTSCPPTSGAEITTLSQYTLQQFGRAMAALGAAPAGPNPPGCWQKYVVDFNTAVAAVQATVAANNAAGCLAATQVMANAMKGIRASGTGMVCTTTPAPTSTTMKSSGY